METAEFSFARWNAALTPPMTYVLLLFPVTLLVASVWVFTLVAQGDRQVGDRAIIAAPIVSLVAIWWLAMSWQWIRYKYALWNRYVFDSRGVLIESGESKVFVPWHEFESAEYLPLFSLLRLKTAAIASPVVIFEPNGPGHRGCPAGRWKITKVLVGSQMSGRFKKRWLP
jgi:hypothetical protein